MSTWPVSDVISAQGGGEVVEREEIENAVLWDARALRHPDAHRHVGEIGGRVSVGIECEVASQLERKSRHLRRQVHARGVTVDLERNSMTSSLLEDSFEVVARSFPRAWP